MSNRTQADQVGIYAHKDLAGVEQYLSLQDYMDDKVLVELQETVAFTLSTAGASFAGTLAMGTALIYLDGSTEISMNGGIPFNATALQPTTIAGMQVNIARVLDANDDGVLDLAGKDVYAIFSTDGADGTKVADGTSTLSFVIRDDASNGWTPFALEAGDYQVQPTTVYTRGSASIAGVLGTSTTGNGSSVDEQSYEEIINLLEGRPHNSYIHAITEYRELPADKKLVINVATATNAVTVKDTADVAVVGTGSQTPDFVLPANAILGTLGSGYAEGIRATYGGIPVRFNDIEITGAEEITIDLSAVLGGKSLYAGSSLIIEWR